MIHIPMTIQAPELTPTRAHDDDAGLDLRTADSIRIPVGGSVEVSTGVAVNIPAGYAGYVHSRSSLGFKYDVALSNSTGVIDAGYTGIIRAKLSNRGQTPVTFNRGDRIIQLIIHKLPQVNYILVKDLEQTQRGTAGFGSTGAA